MLKKNHKLKREDFDIVFKKGKISHTSLFSIRAMPTKTWDECAFSVVISKKRAKQAVLRNKNKRRVYNALNKVLKEVKSPKKGIISLKKDLTNISFQEIQAELKKTLI